MGLQKYTSPFDATQDLLPPTRSEVAARREALPGSSATRSGVAVGEGVDGSSVVQAAEQPFELVALRRLEWQEQVVTAIFQIFLAEGGA